MTLSLPEADTRQLLPVAAAIEATMTGSDSAFRRWCSRWRVTHYRHGKYLRSELAEAMAREAAARQRRGRK